MPAVRSGGPSKVPPLFFEKTIERLLPSKEELNKLTTAELLKLVDKKDELKTLIQVEPVRFWRPNPGGQEGFSTYEGPKRCKFLFSGNKTGKSTAGGIRFMERLLGKALWECEKRSHISYPVPCRGAIFAEDFEAHKQVTIPTLMSWIPHHYFAHEVKNSAGNVIEHRLSNGSTIHYMTYDQGSEKAEGKDWHDVWCDEPPPRDVYTAIFRGLVSTDGELLITATLVKEGWLYDEIEQPHVAYFMGDIDENPWISESAKNDFLNTLTEDERAVRKTGKPTTLIGIIYKSFIDAEPFVGCDPDTPPNGYPTVLVVDPHERKPCHCMWLYVTPENEIIWFDWDLIEGTTRDIQRRLQQHEDALFSRPRLCIMDPNRGKARQIQLETDQPYSWQTVFEKFGYDVLLANDSLTFGHSTTREYLSVTRDEDGSIKSKPRMRFTKACRGKNGPIYQLVRYSWEDWSRKKIERSLKERPRDRYKDFPDIIRYAACADLDYNILRQGYPTLDIWKERDPGFSQGASNIRGYV